MCIKKAVRQERTARERGMMNDSGRAFRARARPRAVCPPASPIFIIKGDGLSERKCCAGPLGHGTMASRAQAFSAGESRGPEHSQPSKRSVSPASAPARRYIVHPFVSVCICISYIYIYTIRPLL